MEDRKQYQKRIFWKDFQAVKKIIRNDLKHIQQFQHFILN